MGALRCADEAVCWQGAWDDFPVETPRASAVADAAGHKASRNLVNDAQQRVRIVSISVVC